MRVVSRFKKMMTQTFMQKIWSINNYSFNFFLIIARTRNRVLVGYINSQLTTFFGEKTFSQELKFNTGFPQEMIQFSFKTIYE